MARDSLSGFFFDVEDWFGSTAVQRMSFAEKGVYLVMLFQEWRGQEHSLPDDPQAVAELIAVSDSQTAEIVAAWTTVRRKFAADQKAPGRITNVRLERTRRQQAFARKKREVAGQVGGKRSAWNRKIRRDLEASNATALPSDATALPSDAIASPSVVSVSVSVSEKSSACVSDRVVTVAPAPLDADLAHRAAALLGRYEALYRERRNGARLALKPSLDHQRAMDLCRVWDSPRLEKLAVILLTTDDDWVSKTDRGFGVFTSRVSWCDDKLRQWELEHA